MVPVPPGPSVCLRPLKPTVKIKGLIYQLERLIAADLPAGSWVVNTQWRQRGDCMELRGFLRAGFRTSPLKKVKEKQQQPKESRTLEHAGRGGGGGSVRGRSWRS